MFLCNVENRRHLVSVSFLHVKCVTTSNTRLHIVKWTIVIDSIIFMPFSTYKCPFGISLNLSFRKHYISLHTNKKSELQGNILPSKSNISCIKLCLSPLVWVQCVCNTKHMWNGLMAVYRALRLQQLSTVSTFKEQHNDTQDRLHSGSRDDW